MRTLKLTIAYDGSHYCGWQVQSRRPSLHATFAEVVSQVAGPVQHLTASGRTDSGVHALGQVVSFDTTTRLSTDVLRQALNAELPDDIVVRSVDEVPLGFHARRHAVSKRYRYLITDGPIRPLFERQYVWHCFGRLNETAMQKAGDLLVGEHDFSSFESPAGRRKSPVRTISTLTVQRGRAGEWHSPCGAFDPIVIEVEANGFLYNMVRVIVGSLVDVGRGNRSYAWIGDVLAAKDRRRAGMTAPAQGLYLLEVKYPRTEPDCGADA